MKIALLLLLILLYGCSTCDDKHKQYPSEQSAECPIIAEKRLASVSTPRAFFLDRDSLRELTKEGETDPNAAYRVYEYYMFSARNMPLARSWLEHSVALGHPIAIQNYESMQEWPGIDVVFKEKQK